MTIRRRFLSRNSSSFAIRVPTKDTRLLMDGCAQTVYALKPTVPTKLYFASLRLFYKVYKESYLGYGATAVALW